MFPLRVEVWGGTRLRRGGLIALCFTEASRAALSSPHPLWPEAAESFKSLLANCCAAAAIGRPASRKFGTRGFTWRVMFDYMSGLDHEGMRNLRLAATKPPPESVATPVGGLSAPSPAIPPGPAAHKEKQTIRKTESNRYPMICSKAPTSPEAATSSLLFFFFFFFFFIFSAK